MIFSIGEELCSGLRNPKPVWPSSSMASTFKIIHHPLHFVAGIGPMLTWSSWLLLDGIVSILEGVHNCLFSLTIPAAVYCGYHEAGMKARSFYQEQRQPALAADELVCPPFRNTGEFALMRWPESRRSMPAADHENSPAEYQVFFGNIFGLSVTYGVYLADEKQIVCMRCCPYSPHVPVVCNGMNTDPEPVFG